jgi:hypothetical protein
MSQISRPFQIVLAVFVLFVAAWFVVLRGHSSGGESSSAQSSNTQSSGAQSAAAQPAAAPSSSSSSGPSSPASTYHGAAPGVAGLTRAIAKARGAVKQSQQNAQQLQEKSAEASSSTAAQGNSAVGSSGAAAASAPGSAAQQSAESAGAAKAANGAPVQQAKVESQLAHGKVAAILFWNPTGSVDAVVRHELQAASAKLHGRLAVNIALSSQVGSFGSFTNAVQVYSTPTILLVNGKGATTSVTGLIDAFAIEQAVAEVKHAR